MGRADYYSEGDYNAVCSMCGFKFKASELSKNWQGMYRCFKCNEPRQPQDFVRAVPDIQTPPWVQPWTPTYRALCFPNDTSAVPGYMTPGCAIPGYLSPANTIPFFQ